MRFERNVLRGALLQRPKCDFEAAGASSEASPGVCMGQGASVREPRVTWAILLHSGCFGEEVVRKKTVRCFRVRVRMVHVHAQEKREHVACAC